MKAKWIGLALAGLALATACGEGRAIFNVDVYSFIQGGGNDTLPYFVPGGVSDTVDNTPVEVSMLGGLGNSSVDSVTITVGADLDNTTGSGALTFQIFFGADSASTYGGTPFLSTGGSLTAGNVTPITGSATFSDTLFNQQTVWVGIRLIAAAAAGPALSGEMQLTALNARIVLRDKF